MAVTPLVVDVDMNSLLATPKRDGKSHFTEAWQLPPPRVQQGRAGGDTTGEGMGGSDNSSVGRGGAYVGLFRPPGGKKSEMGFHMCVAVIPLGAGEGEGTGAVSEGFLDQPSQRHHPEGPHGHEVWKMSAFMTPIASPPTPTTRLSVSISVGPL